MEKRVGVRLFARTTRRLALTEPGRRYFERCERIVQDAILKIEETFRECLILRDVEELSYEEIGIALNLPVSTVRGRLARARRQITERMASWQRTAVIAGSHSASSAPAR